MVTDYDPAAINAVVLLTDGRNEDVNDDLAGLLSSLQAGTEGRQSQPVRVFTIAYGADADQSTLRAGRRGDQRRGLRRVRPGVHRQGVHVRDQQLLTCPP